MKDSRLVELNAWIGSSERQPALWAAFLGLAGSLDICRMSFTGSPTPSAMSTPSLRWFGVAWRDWAHPISGNFLLHCYYSASYLITLFCPGGVAGPPNADCYPTAQSLLCGWSDGLEWSTGCAASDASSPLGSFSL